MKGWLGAGLAALAVLASAPADAQQVSLVPSAALACLTPAAAARGEPEYPFAAFKSGKSGRVKVALSFTGPDLRPKVDVLEREGDDEFVAAVREHVRAFRVPCHDGGSEPARLLFEFVFRPDQRRVLWAEPIDADDPERHALAGCLAHASGRKAPDYPPNAAQLGLQGRVLARLRFERADQAPIVKVFSRPSARLLAREIESWAAGYRLPCLQGKPLELDFVFVYVFEGDAYGFKPGMGLRELLPAVKGIREQRLQFDFTTMRCPFEVSILFRQPFLPNKVGERGSHDPSRRPFLQWLENVQLDLRSGALDSTFGDTLDFQVPCMKIDLNPQKE